MFHQEFPIGIVTQSLSIKDLVKCDGAALYYGEKVWVIGVTPTESQVKNIAEWLNTPNENLPDLSTDSLADATASIIL